MKREWSRIRSVLYGLKNKEFAVADVLSTRTLESWLAVSCGDESNIFVMGNDFSFAFA